MKIQIQIILAFLIGANLAQIQFNPFRTSPYGDFVNQYYQFGSNDFNRYDPVNACEFSYRGYNTYNFNNCVPLHYGLFSEAEVNNYIRNNADTQAAVDAYKTDFNEASPDTYQDWYGLSRYYPAGYNSYRLY